MPEIPKLPEAVGPSRLMELVVKVSTLCDEVTQLQAHPTSQPVRHAVRINDITLAMVSGNVNPTATHIARPFYLRLLRWIKEGIAALKHSGLNFRGQCTVVLNHLTGSARSAFFAKYGNSDRANWTLDMLYSRIANLVPLMQSCSPVKHLECSSVLSPLWRFLLATLALLRHFESVFPLRTAP